jgi:hypothetical protein
MGASWQSPDQKEFIEEHVPSFIQHTEDGTVKTGFWPGFLDKWFKAWPLQTPSLDLAEMGGEAQKEAKTKRKQRINVSEFSLPKS